MGYLGALSGIIRDNYRVSPGLYALGRPDRNSPVLVSCNYKLTLDVLRREMKKRSCWILVVETFGINVWCAAGKKSFSTREVARRVRQSGLDKVVDHRILIIPQLAAPSVAAHELRGLCGFKGVFGPIRAKDLPGFIDNEMKADPGMREVKFPFSERMKVAMVEVFSARKFMAWTMLICFLLAAAGPGGLSLQGTAMSALGAFAVVLTGFLTGTFLVPAILPLLKARAFAAKGLLAGFPVGVVTALVLARSLPEGLAAVAGAAAMSSWFAMHYTGSTPFTSLSGVDREMRLYIPVQGLLMTLAILAWLGGAWFELIKG